VSDAPGYHLPRQRRDAQPASDRREFQVGDRVLIGDSSGLPAVVVFVGSGVTVEWFCEGERCRGCFEPRQLARD
jgi:hypothetical protein